MPKNSTPVDYLKQQYNTLDSMYKRKLILESIKPKFTDHLFTYQNTPPPTTERSPMSQKYYNSCKQYLAMFKSRSYHFLFNDYSIGRFNYVFDIHSKLVSYNLLWFPCPFSIEYLNLSMNERSFLFELLDSIQEIDKFQYGDFTLRTPIRIDFDAIYEGTKIEFHPTSHIHFQSSETRAKNSKVFCLYNFFAFIIENCYPEINHKFHTEDEEAIITKEMLGESAYWLKSKKIDNIDLGSKIITNYSF
jgi:hypothetical protein